MLPFLLMEMQLALRTAATFPLESRAEKLLGLPLNDAVFYDNDKRLHPSYPLNLTLPSSVVSSVRSAPNLFKPQYRGGVTLVTNRSSQLGLPTCVVVTRCIPYGSNGHSYPFPNGMIDPYEPSANFSVRKRPNRGMLANLLTTPYDGPIETRCKVVGTSTCSRSLATRLLKLMDPVSPTQNLPNGWTPPAPFTTGKAGIKPVPA